MVCSDFFNEWTIKMSYRRFTHCIGRCLYLSHRKLWKTVSSVQSLCGLIAIICRMYTLYNFFISSSRFASKKRVDAHMRVHAPKRFACDKCDIVVATKTSLRYHELIHTDKRPHKCGMCEKAFRLSQNLRVHERIHTGLTPFVCPR